MKSILPDCDLIVGTEEEVHIAAGTEDTLEALRIIRELSKAVIVLKRGPMGCVVYPDQIPDALDKGIVGKGFPIEVYNVLGAGDSFMSGFLRGWLRGEDYATSATWANACGAFAVSRHGCTPAYPSWDELQFFFERGIKQQHETSASSINDTGVFENWQQFRSVIKGHSARVARCSQSDGQSRPRGSRGFGGLAGFTNHGQDCAFNRL